jgi:predicted uridylate kinase
MKTSQKKIIILKVGGSKISPKPKNLELRPDDLIDISYIIKLKDFLIERITNHNERFILNVGGGFICRVYQEAAKKANPSISQDELDWIGIDILRANARIVRSIFGEYAYPHICNSVKDLPNDLDQFNIYIVGACEPGHSSNYDAVEFAIYFGSKIIINLSDIKNIYDSDPKTNPDAKMLSAEITWQEYMPCVPSVWEPGLNCPFDPRAAEKAKKQGLSVVFMEGSLENLENYLKLGYINGTVIKPAVSGVPSNIGNF